MRIHVVTTNCALDAATLEGVADRFQEALGRRDRRITRVRVLFTDLNGPRGGPTLACRAEIVLRRGGRLFVEARDVAPLAAAAGAAAVACMAAARMVERRRERRRRPAWRGRTPLSRGMAAAGAGS